MNLFHKYNNATVVLNNEFIFDPWLYGSLYYNSWSPDKKTLKKSELKNISDITHLTRVEAATDNPRITSGVSTRTSVEIAGLLFDGFSLMEAADITIYPQYDATGGVDSERTFVKQIVQKFVSDGSDENLFTDHEIEGDNAA